MGNKLISDLKTDNYRTALVGSDIIEGQIDGGASFGTTIADIIARIIPNISTSQTTLKTTDLLMLLDGTTVKKILSSTIGKSIGISSWVTSDSYIVGNKVIYGKTIYLCLTTHTSGTFITDYITNSYWLPIGDSVGSIRTSAAYIGEANEFLCDGTAKSRTTYDLLYNKLTTSKGTFTVTIASPGVFTLTGHGLLTGHCVELTTTGALPTGLAVNTNYYAIWVSTDTFRLATSLANAIAGTAINTSGSQSGTHTLRFCPWGISTSANFLLPDFQAVVPKGAVNTTGGTRSINSNVKTPPNFGATQEDQFQKTALQQRYFNDANAREESSFNVLSSVIAGISYGSNNSAIDAIITSSGMGTPRTGLQTRDNSIGVNFFIKYE